MLDLDDLKEKCDLEMWIDSDIVLELIEKVEFYEKTLKDIKLTLEQFPFGLLEAIEHVESIVKEVFREYADED